jgi:uncharacterized protein
MRCGLRTLGLAAVGMMVAAAGCEVVDPASTEPLVIAGGGTAGVYYHYGAQLAEVAAQRLDLDVEVRETDGSVENLRLVADGTAALAFTAADAAADAVTGQPPFEQPLPIQAVARVYDDFVHVVVVADTDISGLRDLESRRVSLGAKGSGTEVIARRLLRTEGIDPDALDNAMLGINASIEELRAGAIDAFFWSGGLSTPGLLELADDVPLRLLPLVDLVDSVSERYGHVYRHAVVPRGTYGLVADVSTMAVPNYLVAHADLDASLVHEVLQALFERRTEMAREVEAVGLLDRRRAIFTEPVELHDGALNYYRHAKMWVSAAPGGRHAALGVWGRPGRAGHSPPRASMPSANMASGVRNP